MHDVSMMCVCPLRAGRSARSPPHSPAKRQSSQAANRFSADFRQQRPPPPTALHRHRRSHSVLQLAPHPWAASVQQTHCFGEGEGCQAAGACGAAMCASLPPSPLAGGGCRSSGASDGGSYHGGGQFAAHLQMGHGRCASLPSRQAPHAQLMGFGLPADGGLWEDGAAAAAAVGGSNNGRVAAPLRQFAFGRPAAAQPPAEQFPTFEQLQQQQQLCREPQRHPQHLWQAPTSLPGRPALERGFYSAGAALQPQQSPGGRAATTDGLPIMVSTLCRVFLSAWSAFD